MGGGQAQPTTTLGGIGALNNGSGFYNENQLQQQASFVNSVQGNQNALGTQLQGVANGTGPNPALSQLQATTQQNVGQANAQLAANRNLNPALAAKMANQNLVQTNQQANNQAATLSSQQQLGAMSQLGSLYGQEQQGAIGQQQVMNSANLGAQQINAGAATNNANNSQSQTNSVIGALGSAAGAGLGYLTGGGGSTTGGYGDTSDGDYQDTGAQSQPGGSDYVGPVQPGGGVTGVNANPGGGAIAATVNYKGGVVKDPIKMADGGVATYDALSSSPPANGPQSTVGQYLQGLGGVAFQTLNKGGKVNALLSPGEKYLTPAEAREVATAKEKVTAVGKKVPGKAKYAGNDLRNDTVLAKLTEGGVVVPRTAMGSVRDATAFVRAHLAKKGRL